MVVYEKELRDQVFYGFFSNQFKKNKYYFFIGKEGQNVEKLNYDGKKLSFYREIDAKKVNDSRIANFGNSLYVYKIEK